MLAATVTTLAAPPTSEASCTRPEADSVARAAAPERTESHRPPHEPGAADTWGAVGGRPDGGAIGRGGGGGRGGGHSDADLSTLGDLMDSALEG